MKSILSLLLITISLNLSAQKNSDQIEWGLPHSCGSHLIEGVGILFDHYITVSPNGYGGANFRSYDMNNYKLIKAASLDRRIDSYKLKYNQLEIFGNNLLLFAYYKAGDGKIYHVMQKLDEDFKVVETYQLGTSNFRTKSSYFSRYSNISEDGIVVLSNEMFYRWNADKSKLLLFDKEDQQTWKVKVIGDDLNIDGAETFNYVEPLIENDPNRIVELAAHVDASSVIVSLRSEHTVEYYVDEKSRTRVKAYDITPGAKKYIVVTDHSAGTSNTIDLTMDFCPMQAKITMLEDKSILIAGTYSNGYKSDTKSYLPEGTFLVKIKPDHSIAYINKRLFDNALVSIVDNSSEDAKMNTDHLFVEDVVVYDSGALSILMEREQATRTGMGYRRTRNEIIIVNALTDGALQSEHVLDKYQDLSGIGGEDASSFKAEKLGNEIYLVYNSKGKGVAPELKSKSPYYSSKIHVEIVKVTAENVVDARELYMYPSSYTSIVSPRSSMLLYEKEYLIFCKNLKRQNAKVARIFIQNVFK